MEHFVQRIVYALFALLWCQISFAQDTALETVAAVQREIVRERVLEGVIEAVHQSTVSAQTSGRVAQVHYDVDDFVTKDSVLVSLHDTEQQAQLTQAQANVQSARARLEQFNRSLKRAQTLYSQNGMSKAMLEAAQADAQSGRASLDAAQAAVIQMKQQLAYTEVLAPYDGVVVNRYVEVGETVSPGTPLFTGFSLEELRVRVHVPQRLVSDIRQQQIARVIYRDEGEVSIPAKQLTFFPYANEGSNTFTVRVDFSVDGKRLFPGMLTKVAFVVGQRSVLLVPKSAVVYRSEVVGVYVVDPAGNIQLRQVRTSDTTAEGMTEILTGLKAGEHVAIDPIKAGLRYIQSARQS